MADLNVSVGDDASSREDLMMEIRVTLTDATTAHGLLGRLAVLFDRSSVSFDGACNEVRVCSEWESRSVVQVIDAVQSWLAADGVSSAKLSVGERSYTMVGPAGIATANGERRDRPRRRMKTSPAAWHCNCWKPLGLHQLNPPHRKRCPVCGVAHHQDPPALKRDLAIRQPQPASADARPNFPQT